MILTGLFYLFTLPLALAEGVLVGELIYNFRRYHSKERDLSVTIIIALGLLLAGVKWCGNALGANVDWPFVILIGVVGCGYSFIDINMYRLQEKERKEKLMTTTREEKSETKS